MDGSVETKTKRLQFISHPCATNDWAPWLCIASILVYALLLTQPPQDQGYSITPERFLCQQQAGSR